MRSAIVAAAFAAGALAVPLMERDVVYETDVVYATQYVTVTAGDVQAPTSTAEAVEPTTTTAAEKHFHGHRKPKTWAWTSEWATTWTESAPASSAVQQPPAYSAPAYSSAEESPAPAPTTYAQPSTYEAPSPTSQAPASSAPASSASGAKPTDYKGFVIHHHNLHRANHSASDLTWSDSLAATAKKIGQSCKYAHNTEMDGGGYGQNIAAGVKSDNVSAVITELFYNGEVNLYADQYGKQSPDMTNFEEWGHFTQIVWKGTTKVGCATVDCSSQGLANTGGNVPPYFTVCNYESPGNYADEYADNVGESRGDKTCHWNDGM